MSVVEESFVLLVSSSTFNVKNVSILYCVFVQLITVRRIACKRGMLRHVCPSFRLSVTHVNCIKTAKHINFSLRDSLYFLFSCRPAKHHCEILTGQP